MRRAVAHLKRGDLDALDFLYVSYVREIVRTIRPIVGDHHEAEDVAHDVFAKLPRVINRYQEREVPFSAWIARVARNAALDHIRARRQIPVEEVRVSDTGADELSHQLVGDLEAALSQLPAEQRRVVAMRHIAGLDPAEIARRMGKSEPAIHGLHHRGRAAMKSLLSDLGAAPAGNHPPTAGS